MHRTFGFGSMGYRSGVRPSYSTGGAKAFIATQQCTWITLR